MPTVQEQPAFVQSSGRKRKHSTSGPALEGDPDPDSSPDRHPKQQRTSSQPTEVASGEPAMSTGAYTPPDPVAFWAKEGRWPEEQDWPEETSETEAEFTMDRLLARKRSTSATSTTPSDQRPREEKSAPYRDPFYATLLETKDSFMRESELGITDESKTLCQTLLETVQAEPQDTLFRSDIFESTCRKMQNRNEARIIRDITPLIVPPAELLCTYGASHLKHVIESVNEGWNHSIPLTKPRPQPDYSIGFRRDAFTEDQLAKLSPFIGDLLARNQSLFLATYYMYFPFLTCEVNRDLDTANRQNAHSMTLAVRGVVELFRAAKRQDEVNRKILAFSVSHDDQVVLIYGHYPVITAKGVKYYRHPIYAFDFTTLGGKEKWTAYRFTKNVYDIWVPKHFEKICSAIDQLPLDADFDGPPLSEASGLSQDLGDEIPSSACSDSAGEQDGQSSVVEQHVVTLGTSSAPPVSSLPSAP